jgi:hypothetical protein
MMEGLCFVISGTFLSKHNTKSDDRGVDWTYLAQDRDQWWAPVNMIMNLKLPY